MITLGLDLGAVFTKAVLLDGDRLAASSLTPTTGTTAGRADELVDALLAQAGMARTRVATIAATGRGGDQVEGAAFHEEEVACVAAAVSYFMPGVEGIIHLGGQSIAVMTIDDQGRILRIGRNDKCAAGTGRFLETMARKLGLEVGEVDALAARARRSAPVSHQCVVYAESEAISRLNDGERPEDILAGLCDALARIISAQGRRLRRDEPYTLTGGLARSGAVVERIGAALPGPRRSFPHDPILAAALGAALLEEDDGEG